MLDFFLFFSLFTNNYWLAFKSKLNPQRKKMANGTGSTDSDVPFDVIDYVQLAIYPVILLFGSIGNILVILVIRNKKNHRKINDYFILNLAISDLCMLTISISADFYLKFREFPLGDLLCKGVWPLMTMCLFASVFTLTCMAIERWRTIVKPLSLRLAVSKVIWILVFTWIAGLACVSPLTVVAYHKGRSCEEEWSSFSMRQAYTVAVVLLQYALPLFIITIAYARIGIFLKHRAKLKISDTCTRSTAATIRRNASNAKINKNLRTIVILFAIFMLPKQVLWLWLDFSNGGDFIHFRDVLIFSEILLYVHSSTNPVVYGTILQEYRSGICHYLSRIFPFFGGSCSHGSQVHPDRKSLDKKSSNSNSMALANRMSCHLQSIEKAT